MLRDANKIDQDWKDQCLCMNNLARSMERNSYSAPTNRLFTSLVIRPSHRNDIVSAAEVAWSRQEANDTSDF
jgi:hypothetical protein